MNQGWYYADKHGQQQGPVDAGTLQRHVRYGVLGPSSLVWREGMRSWVALSQVAIELDIDLPDAPPPLPAAAVASAVVGTRIAPPAKKSGALVVLIILAVLAVPVLGIIAAVAIPAYNDFTVRAKLGSGLDGVNVMRATVEELFVSEGRCPVNEEDGFLAESAYANSFRSKIVVGSLSRSDTVCAIEVSFKPGFGEPTGESGRLLMYLEGGTWTYETNLPPRVLPAAIRNALAE